jgi:hypothetical protein
MLEESIFVRRHPKRAAWLVFGVLLVLSFALRSWSQSTQGAVLGTVKDANGAVVAGAIVTLTNTDKGTVRTTTTSAIGDYQFLDVTAAHYTVEVTAPGFEKWSITNAQLTARQQLRVDATLVVGSVQQTVLVSGDNASAIETESPKIGSVYTSNDLLDMPTNFRAGTGGNSAVQAIGSMPGVQTHEGSFSLQGALPYQMDVTVDGISILGSDSGYLTATPTADAISEMHADGVMTNAEFGDPAQVSFTSKGGGNAVHGGLWWYHQDSSLNATDFGSATKPHMVGNTFGGSFSGPVVIPHLYNGHDKTFFYGDYEGYRLPNYVSEQYTVPTTAMKQGDFSSYSNPTVGFNGLTDPYTGLSWGDTIPNSAMSSIASQFLQFYPDPNHTATANGASVPTTAFVSGESPNYYVNKDASTHLDQVDARGDKYFGSNQKVLLWGRYTYKNSPSNSPQVLDFPDSTANLKQTQITASLSWTAKPNVINEFRYGFTRQNANKSNAFNGKAFTQGLGFQGLQNLWFNGVPTVEGFTTITSFTPGHLTQPSESTSNIFADSVSWTHGKHDFKFGVDIHTYEAIFEDSDSNSDQYGNFSFSNQGDGIGDFTGVDFGDFLTGIPDNSTYDVVNSNIDGVANEYHAYAQDQWKITPRLTLTYGIRYEYHPAFYDKGGDIGNFDPSVPLSGRVIYMDGKQGNLAQNFLASANACDPDGVHNTNSAVVNGAPCMPVVPASALGLPEGLRNATKVRFLPRLGFAYRLTDDSKWVVRGGFGMYNDTLLGQTMNSLTETIQENGAEYVNTLNSVTHQPNFAWPQLYAGSSTGSGACTTCYGQENFSEGDDPKFRDPWTTQYALGVDHDFGAGYAARATFIGSASRHLQTRMEENTLPYSSSVSSYNQPQSLRTFPNWGRLSEYLTGANESYNSFQVEASHRMQHGLHLDSIFTWAKAMTDDSGPNDVGFAGERGSEAGTSIFNMRLDYGRATGTRDLVWATTAVYDLPVGRGRQFGNSMPHVLDAIVGGWRLSNIFTWQTGAWLTPYFSAGQGDPSGTGSGLSASAAGWLPGNTVQHADKVAGVSWRPAHQNRNNWVNGSAFTCPGWSAWQLGEPCSTGAGYKVVNGVTTTTPRSSYGPALPIGRFGNTGIGTVEGPGYINLNSGLSKVFSITERVKLRAEGTFTNVFNHTNLNESTLNMTLSSSSFGVITSGIAARNGQVSLRLDF